MELGDIDNALDSYTDAVNNSDNEFTAPRYMMKQAMVYEMNGDFSSALEVYETIKSEYKSSREAAGIDKFIARAARS